jgi:hypothetical protein
MEVSCFLIQLAQSCFAHLSSVGEATVIKLHCFGHCVFPALECHLKAERPEAFAFGLTTLSSDGEPGHEWQMQPTARS